MNKSNYNTSNEAFLQALTDVSTITGNVGQLAGLVSSIINARIAHQDYQLAQNQLKVVMIQREMILRKFDSLENFIRLAFEERATVLKSAEMYIRNGMKKKNQVEISIGLQIIKAVLLTNPFHRNKFDENECTIAYKMLDSEVV